MNVTGPVGRAGAPHSAEAVGALQSMLAAEHAALWLYGLLGARTSASDNPYLYRTFSLGYLAHQAQRDQLVAMIADSGAAPVAAAASYRPPTRLASATDLQQAGHEFEDRCAATYAAAVAQTVGEQRGWAINALAAAAVRQLNLGGTPQALPGSE